MIFVSCARLSGCALTFAWNYKCKPYIILDSFCKQFHWNWIQKFIIYIKTVWMKLFWMKLQSKYSLNETAQFPIQFPIQFEWNCIQMSCYKKLPWYMSFHLLNIFLKVIIEVFEAPHKLPCLHQVASLITLLVIRLGIDCACFAIAVASAFFLLDFIVFCLILCFDFVCLVYC